MKSMRRRLDRLQRNLPDGKNVYDDPAWQEALTQLTDDELRCLRDALKRRLDPQRPDEILLSPAERAAYERLCALYKEARSP